MGKTRLLRWASGVILAKLGRCSFCMGFALSGAVLGWAALAAIASLWPGFPFLNVLALWPIGFTALWFLHIATSGARAVASERREMPGPDMTRRRTVGVFASAVALAILASAVAAPRAWAFKCCSSDADCPKNHRCSLLSVHCPNQGACGKA